MGDAGDAPVVESYDDDIQQSRVSGLQEVNSFSHENEPESCGLRGGRPEKMQLPQTTSKSCISLLSHQLTMDDTRR